MNAVSIESLRGTGRLLGCRSNKKSPHIWSFTSLAHQGFEPPSMKAARRAGWNSLAFRLERSTVDDENSPLTSSRISQRESEADEKPLTAHRLNNRRFKSENPASPAEVDEVESQTLAGLAAVQLLESCWTLPVEYIPTEWAGSPPPPSGYTSGGEPVPIMMTTLTMHVKYGRSTNMSDNTSWRPAAGPRRVSEPWRSVWRSGYDGPWSSTSDRSGARNSLEKAPEPTRSRSSVDNGSSNSATERLRRLRLRAKGRYRRALNVSEASDADSALLPGRAAVELDRLDEMEDESVVDQDRPPIPYTTCPKSAPAILLSQTQNKSFPEPFVEHRLSLPPRSLSSQSYRGLPMYNARKGVVADKIRSLGRILRSDSSSQSATVSEFPTPLDAKERRRQARDPYELHSESVSSSPLFNSPSSESARSPIGTAGGIFDPLVRAGTLLATGELDRLSFLAHSRGRDLKLADEGSSGESSGISPKGNAPSNTPATCLRASNAAAIPLPQTDGVLTPVVPANTPASDIATPATPHRTRSFKHDHRRRGAGSRLSEMYMSQDAPENIPQDSGSQSGSVITTPPDETSLGKSASDKGADKCERHDIYRNLVPKPLSLTPSPPRNVHGRTGPNRAAKPDASKPLPQEKLDMDHLNELLDNAISNSIVTQRLNAVTSSLPHLAGAHPSPQTPPCTCPDQQKMSKPDASEPPQSLPLGSVGNRPFIESRAGSPGPHRDRSARNLSTLSAASPVIKRHMAKHVSRSRTPTDSHVVACLPSAWDPDRGNGTGDSEVFCPVTMADTLGHEQRPDSGAKGKRAKVRRSTSGTVHMVEMVECSEKSSSDTGSSDSEPPLADDGCPQEFARLKALREQLHYIIPGKLPEEKDSIEC